MFGIDEDIAGCRVLGQDTSFLDEPSAYADGLSRLSRQRREKAASFRFAKDRKESAAAAIMLDRLLAERGLREADMSYCESSEGKPSFEGYPDLFFSLAHSGNAAVAALSLRPVGIDLEYLPDFPYDMAEPRLWTEMEAVGKLLGCGVGCYVDSGAFAKPDNISTLHIEQESYLICLATTK